MAGIIPVVPVYGSPRQLLDACSREKIQLSKEANDLLIYSILSDLSPAEWQVLIKSLLAENLVTWNQEEFVVEEVLDQYENDDGLFYLIKWDQWPEEFNTWEKAENLQCMMAVKKFHECGKPPYVSKPHQEKLLYLSNKCSMVDAAVMFNHVKRMKLNLRQVGALRKDVTLFSALREEQCRLLADWERQSREAFPGDAAIAVENEVDLEVFAENFHFFSSYVFGKVEPLGRKKILKKSDFRSAAVVRGNSSLAYTSTGRVKVAEGTEIYECCGNCLCLPKCNNRIVQQGRQHKVTIFRTSNGRGWGLRAGQRIPASTFVSDYIGEVLSTAEANSRCYHFSPNGHNYLFEMNCTELHSNFTIDASQFGNVSRFLNHSCQPNLQQFLVWFGNDPMTKPRICFFTKGTVEKGEELTIDYHINVSARKQKMSTLGVKCLCGMQNCMKFLF